MAYRLQVGKTPLIQQPRYGNHKLGRAYIGGQLAYGVAPEVAYRPSFSPFAYYDGLNEANTSATWFETITGGEAFDMDQARGSGVYNTAGYYVFTTDDYAPSGGTLSDKLNTLGSREHTIITVFNTDTRSNDDIVGNIPGANAVLFMNFNNKIRGHAWNSSGTVNVTDATNITTLNTWWFGAQRNSATFQLDVFSGALATANPTKTTGGTVAVTTPGTAGGKLTIGTRGNDVKWFDGEIAQVVIYDKALTDSEIETVRGELVTHTGL